MGVSRRSASAVDPAWRATSSGPDPSGPSGSDSRSNSRTESDSGYDRRPGFCTYAAREASKSTPPTRMSYGANARWSALLSTVAFADSGIPEEGGQGAEHLRGREGLVCVKGDSRRPTLPPRRAPGQGARSGRRPQHRNDAQARSTGNGKDQLLEGSLVLDRADGHRS